MVALLAVAGKRRDNWHFRCRVIPGWNPQSVCVYMVRHNPGSVALFLAFFGGLDENPTVGGPVW